MKLTKYSFIKNHPKWKEILNFIWKNQNRLLEIIKEKWEVCFIYNYIILPLPENIKDLIPYYNKVCLNKEEFDKIINDFYFYKEEIIWN